MKFRGIFFTSEYNTFFILEAGGFEGEVIDYRSMYDAMFSIGLGSPIARIGGD